MTRRGLYFLLYGAVAAGLIALVFFLESIDMGRRDRLIAENGWIETVSASGYFVGLLTLFFLMRKNDASGWHVMLLLLFFGLRELDFHSRFTPMGIFKTRFYLSPDIPILTKLVGLAVIALIVNSVYRLARVHLREWLINLRHREPYAIGLSLGMLFLVIAKIDDGLLRKLAWLGIPLTHHADRLAITIEEVVEMGIPMVFLIAIVARFRVPPATTGRGLPPQQARHARP